MYSFYRTEIKSELMKDWLVSWAKAWNFPLELFAAMRDTLCLPQESEQVKFLIVSSFYYPLYINCLPLITNRSFYQNWRCILYYHVCSWKLYLRTIIIYARAHKMTNSFLYFTKWWISLHRYLYNTSRLITSLYYYVFGRYNLATRVFRNPSI